MWVDKPQMYYQLSLTKLSVILCVVAYLTGHCIEMNAKTLFTNLNLFIPDNV